MLTEEIERLKKEIAENFEGDSHPDSAPDSAPDVAADSAPDSAPEAAPKEEKLDDSGYARLRREARAAEKKAEALQEEITALKKKPESEEVVEPVYTPDPEIEEIKKEHLMGKAEREFEDLEREFKAKTADYEGVSTEFARALAGAIKVQNPRMTLSQVAEETKKALLTKASNFARDGFDPVEELYHEAKSLGFTGDSLKKKEDPSPEAEVDEIKPDMAKVAANRKKSAGMAATGGKSEGVITKAAAADYSPKEWMALPKAEKARLLKA